MGRAHGLGTGWEPLSVLDHGHRGVAAGSRGRGEPGGGHHLPPVRGIRFCPVGCIYHHLQYCGKRHGSRRDNHNPDPQDQGQGHGSGQGGAGKRIVQKNMRKSCERGNDPGGDPGHTGYEKYLRGHEAWDVHVDFFFPVRVFRRELAGRSGRRRLRHGSLRYAAPERGHEA